MKSTFLITVILLLSVQLRLNNGVNTDRSFAAYITVNELLGSTPRAPEKNDSIATGHKELKKAPANTVKKEKLKKNKRGKWQNKLSSANQSNLQLHKRVSQPGIFTAKGAVQFDFDQHELRDIEAFNQVMHIADQLLFDSTQRVSIAGYTDNIGSNYYNDSLSSRRAENIKDYLVELGVNESQIHLSFNGMADPVSDNAGESGRAENRRVEFVLFAAG
ncbi:MAG: OmpA family protein [Chitinophagaceae bacterium]|nr:OmpA family protein [Chitinophagaceae bacterium]